MSQPSTEGSPPPVPAKAGCGRTILKGLLVLIVIGAAVGIFLWQKNERTKRANREDSILTELSQQPLSLALKALQASDQAKSELGSPIAAKEERGNIRREEATGELDPSDARFSFDADGPKGDAVVDVAAKRADGIWQLSKVTVKLAGGKTIDVPPPPADAPPELDFGP